MNWLNWRNAGLAAVLAVGIALPAMAAVYEKQGVLVPPDTHIKLGDSSALRFGDSTGGYSDPSTYDITARWDGTDFDWLPNANNTVMKFGNGTVSFDIWAYGATSAAYLLWDASVNDLFFVDSVSAKFGNDGDVEMRWDGTDFDVLVATDDYVIKWGNGTQSADQWWYGNTATEYILWDASADDLIFQDSVSIKLGTGSDAELRWDATDLDLLAAADDQIFKIGNGTNSWDLWLFGNTANTYVSWDASADDLKFEDSTSLMFGTGSAAGPGAAGDVEMRWDGTDLDILAAADDSVIKFGTGTNSFDVWFYGDTAAAYLLWDASANDLFFYDSVSAKFGDQGDVEFRWDGTDFDVLVATDDYVIKWGNGTQSADQWFYGNTASDYLLIDASANTISTQGDMQFVLNDFKRRVVAKDAAAVSVAAADSGTIFTNGGASGSITFTLPAVAAGLEYEFYAEDAQAITVDGPADTLVIFADNAADSVAFSTGGEIIGSSFRAVGNAGGTKWLIEVNTASDSVSVTTAT